MARQARSDGEAGRLAPSLSLHLDLLRLLAAGAVFLGHAGVFLFEASDHHPLFDHGREAVAVFFVLSGFVIAHVAAGREASPRDYALARLARLWSVVVPTLALTVVCDRIGWAANPQWYATLDFWHPASWSALVTHLTFTNQLWLSHDVFGSDEPFWSLGFEAPYYLAFGLAIFTRGRLRLAALALWAVVVGPKILAYLPLWGQIGRAHV